jgi:hypothetical protein
MGCTDDLYNVGEMCKVSLRKENQLWVLDNTMDYYEVRSGLRQNPSPIGLIESSKGKTQLQIDIATAEPCVFQEFYLAAEHEIDAIYEDTNKIVDVVKIAEAANESKFLK